MDTCHTPAAQHPVTPSLVNSASQDEKQSASDHPNMPQDGLEQERCARAVPEAVLRAAWKDAAVLHCTYVVDGAAQGCEASNLCAAWADSSGELLQHSSSALHVRLSQRTASDECNRAAGDYAVHWSAARCVLAQSTELLRRCAGAVAEPITHLCIAIPVAMSSAIWPWMQLPWLLRDMGCSLPDALKLISIVIVAADAAQECEDFLVCVHPFGRLMGGFVGTCPTCINRTLRPALQPVVQPVLRARSGLGMNREDLCNTICLLFWDSVQQAADWCAHTSNLCALLQSSARQ
jgi:hypothetical protein